MRGDLGPGLEGRGVSVTPAEKAHLYPQGRRTCSNWPFGKYDGGLVLANPCTQRVSV